MKKVLLLNPPSRIPLYKEDRCQNEIDQHLQNVVRPPISLMSLAAISEELGFKTKIMDAPIEGIKQNEFEQFLSIWKPDWVVVNASIGTLESDLLALKIAKEKGAKTISFGYAPTIKDSEIMEGNEYIDFAIRGEPEKTFQELMEDSTSLENIKGLTFWEKNKIRRNDNREFIENLDDLPFPAHHLIKNKFYKVPTTGEIFTTIQTSKGCPYNCTFCLTPLINGKKVRKRSVKSIITEIKLITRNLDIHNFFFRADTFTFEKQWVLQLCQEIMRNKLEITWFCNSRVDTVDQEMLNAMKRAGCQLITFGVESGSNRVLQLIKKSITKKQIIETIRLTKKIGILTGTFYIIGLPGDTLNSIHETIQFSREVDSDLVEFIPFIPFLGTIAFQQPSPKLDQSLLRRLTRYALIRFYFRPKILLRQIRNFYVKVQGFTHLINIILISLKTVRRILGK